MTSENLSVDQTYLTCQQRLQVIEKALQSTSSTFGFTVTLKFAQELLVQLIAQKKTLSPVGQKSLVSFAACLDKYDKYLKTQETTRWKKLLNSNKLRKLDLLDTALYNATVDLTRETNSTLLVTLLKEDEEAQKMWESEFGLKQLIVPWEPFVQGLNKHLELNDEVRHKLKWILDKGHTGYVTLFRFSELLKSFGPFKTCLTKVSEILDLPFFYGYLTSSEAEIILRRSTPGSYLIRFSISRSRSFALSFLDTNHMVKHCIIECLPHGFIINELINSNSRDRVFSNLSDLCNCYTKALKSPLSCPLVKESFFHGDLSTEDTLELLQGQPEGTYLFRLCNQENQIVLSYMTETGSRSQMVSWTAEGFAFLGHSQTFPTLPTLVQSRSELKIPVGNPRTYKGFILALRSPLRMISMDDDFSSLGRSTNTSYGNIYDAIPNLEKEARIIDGKSISGPGLDTGSVPDTPLFTSGLGESMSHHNHISSHSENSVSAPFVSQKSSNNYIMMPKVPKKKAQKSIFSFHQNSSASTTSISSSLPPSLPLDSVFGITPGHSSQSQLIHHSPASSFAPAPATSTSTSTAPTPTPTPTITTTTANGAHTGVVAASPSSSSNGTSPSSSPPSPPSSHAQNGTQPKNVDLSRNFIAGSCPNPTEQTIPGVNRESSQRSSLGQARTSVPVPGFQISSSGGSPGSPIMSCKSTLTSHLTAPIPPSSCTSSGSSPSLHSRLSGGAGSTLINRSHSQRSPGELELSAASLPEKSLLKDASEKTEGDEEDDDKPKEGSVSIPKSRSNVALNSRRPYSGKSLFIKRQISQQTTLPISFYRTAHLGGHNKSSL